MGLRLSKIQVEKDAKNNGLHQNMMQLNICTNFNDSKDPSLCMSPDIINRSLFSISEEKSSDDKTLSVDSSKRNVKEIKMAFAKTHQKQKPLNY